LQGGRRKKDGVEVPAEKLSKITGAGGYSRRLSIERRHNNIESRGEVESSRSGRGGERRIFSVSRDRGTQSWLSRLILFLGGSVIPRTQG
jgi:hypothetical protein